MRISVLATLIALLTTTAALSQTYPGAMPVPRTTSAPALADLAKQREVEERFRIGLAALSAANYKGAAAEFARVVAINPAEPKGSTARYDLAIAYANLQREDDAAAQLRAAIELDPGFLAAMANLVAVDLARGDFTEARSVADRFLALAPDSARALYARGIVALGTGDAATAREDFGKLLHSNPAYAVAHYDLAIAEERLGHMDAAERELRTALSLAPTYARAEFALGAVLLRQGRRSEARDAFVRTMQDASGDPALLNIAAAMRDSIAI
ncbi:MAG: tetratricopeptide repeat protein [Candidatus Eremiobacteraeota bacterium]|nr:tetratricopeptide repeat protein [Candidatus Eremiobacteraeota bacterium]MBV8283792.1 tetratricopeptide repeat protein [Candidatus Eremiobacteraeota bacterium]